VTLAIIESALGGQVKIAVPDMSGFHFLRSAQYVEESGTLKCGDAQAVFHRFDIHTPFASVRGRVVVAVVDEGLQVKVKRAGSG
jgi:hypothetical protein